MFMSRCPYTLLGRLLYLTLLSGHVSEVLLGQVPAQVELCESLLNTRTVTLHRQALILAAVEQYKAKVQYRPLR